MLEFKLLDHLKPGEFNKDNLTRSIMNNLLDNLFMKSLHELKQEGGLNVMATNQMAKVCLEKVGKTMALQPDPVIGAFKSYLKEHQKEEIFDDAAKMGEYLVGALPLLIEEYILTSENFKVDAE